MIMCWFLKLFLKIFIQIFSCILDDLRKQHNDAPSITSLHQKHWEPSSVFFKRPNILCQLNVGCLTDLHSVTKLETFEKGHYCRLHVGGLLDELIKDTETKVERK